MPEVPVEEPNVIEGVQPQGAVATAEKPKDTLPDHYTEEDKQLRDAFITDLAVTYFRQRGYKIERDTFLEGFSGLPRSFDLLIQKGREQRLAWIRDWKRID